MNVKKGFTLIELLVVVAIIGVLSTIVITNLSSSREGGYDAAIQSNLSTIRTQAEVYFNSSLNYGTAFAEAACSGAGAGTMFGGDTTIGNAIASASTANGGTQPTCVSTDSGSDGNADSWAVLSPLRSSGNWCVDSTGFSGTSTALASGACN